MQGQWQRGEGRLSVVMAGTRLAMTVRQRTGLALSNRLARVMNGRLAVNSRSGTGAMVSLSLPAT
ncbi:hypothetical protein CCS01_04825 [Rhodopila globiformis]|uniref:Histidine kinase/HSP90-like ATPase domain-containing protein n=1 Tax=Rhodopila globiformis TaxID=1071 RepID=A0A2S6NLW5_RHOGL|nr:hypothetical protein CCS01_04825 [Rhodopila globiformis]